MTSLVRTLALVAALGIAIAGAAATADERDDLGTVKSELEANEQRQQALQAEAEKLAAEIAATRQRLVAAARAAQEQEQAITDLEATLATLDEREQDGLERLERRRGQMLSALMGLQRLSLHPPDSIVAIRASPTETVRSGLLLRAAVPGLRREAEDLRAGLQALVDVRRQARETRAAHDARLAALATERKTLDQALARMARLRQQQLSELEKTRSRHQALADKARDLEDLIARLDEESRVVRPRDDGSTSRLVVVPSLRSFDAARGAVTLPARGRTVGRYGDDAGLGATSRGLTIETRAGAQVVAPYDGKVAYAGRFRGYGQILIIEHADEYHTLLAGFARLYAVAGQWVLAGEPVGAMGGAEGEAPRLYVELRRNGQPINPSPWLTAQDNRD